MNITVKKPTQAQIGRMQTAPIWECPVSTFDWSYGSTEEALILEGEVTVEYGDKSVRFGPGDYVTFPKGLSCTWKVSSPVRKHYMFES